MAQGTPVTRRELEGRLIARAWKDEAFKQELLRDPKAVVEREAARLRPGASLPADLEVQVVEETPTTLFLVLPASPVARPGGDLSDADLEQVARGKRSDDPEDTMIADLVTWECCN